MIFIASSFAPRLIGPDVVVVVFAAIPVPTYNFVDDGAGML